MDREFRAAIEQRVDDESRTVSGYAALYDSPSIDMGFIETIQRGAFASSLREAHGGRAIFAFWNHNTDLVLGSTRSNTLRLTEDGRGLRFELDAEGLTEHQIRNIKQGDMQMSFGFSVRDDAEEWSCRGDGKRLRTLKDVNLYEVSPVAMPAYPDTSVAMRALEQFERVQQQVEEEALKLHNQQGYRLRTLAKVAESAHRIRNI